MSIRDENHCWKNEAQECIREVNKLLSPIFEKYSDKFSYEDLYYLICTEVNSIIMREVFKHRIPVTQK